MFNLSVALQVVWSPLEELDIRSHEPEVMFELVLQHGTEDRLRAVERLIETGHP